MDDKVIGILDGLLFHDHRRYRSSEVTRAFCSASRAVSRAPRSEMSEPDEVSLEPDDAISETEIVRGAD